MINSKHMPITQINSCLQPLDILQWCSHRWYYTWWPRAVMVWPVTLAHAHRWRHFVHISTTRWFPTTKATMFFKCFYVFYTTHNADSNEGGRYKTHLIWSSLQNSVVDLLYHSSTIEPKVQTILYTLKWEASTGIGVKASIGVKPRITTFVSGFNW